MAANILNVVIDERKQLESIDDLTFIRYNRGAKAEFSTTQKVFKDYILSTESFWIAAESN